jgi:predicted  nucleic acid-binding Zn-ribbon protein
MKKNILSIPLVGMMEGEETNPYKDFVNGLGLSEDILGRLEKGEDVVEDFTTNYSQTLKTRHSEDWAKSHRENLEKEIRVGNYKSIQNKIAKRFELDLKEFEGKDKPTELMLEAAVEKYKNQLSQLEEKFKTTNDSTKTQLSSQLDQANNLLKSKEHELIEALNKLNNLPELIEAGKEDLRKEMFVESQVNKTINDLRGVVIDAIPNNVLKTIVSNLAKFEAKKGENGYSVNILNPQTSSPYQKSKTENYKSLEEFIKAEILIKNNWIKQQTQTPKAGVVSDADEGRDGKNKKSYVHPNARKAAGL